MRFLQRVFLSLGLVFIGFAQAAPPVSSFAVAPGAISLAPPHQEVRAALSPGLQQALGNAQPNDRLRIIIRLKSAIRKSEKNAEAHENLLRPYLELDRTNAVAQRTSLVTALQVEANTAQTSLQQFLTSPEAQTKADAVRPFWVFNGMALRATSDLINTLAQRDDVEAIQLDALHAWAGHEVQNVTASLPISQSLISNFQSPLSPISYTLDAKFASATVAPEPGTFTWGISKIRADQVQQGLGITGRGVVVANIDSGVDWQHPALRANYRGYGNGIAPDHLHNWVDTTDEAAAYPLDSVGHGTHVMGTMVGQNGIGVAPGAKWMAVKAGTAIGLLDSWLLAAFQFVLAPGGDPAFAPDIINNSWTDIDGTNDLFKQPLLTLKAAGIFVVFANGNAGPKGGTVGAPASLPQVIGVGATDSDDEVAYFSSRGPSPIDKAIKPDLSAPGVRVLSSVPGGIYKYLSGTSMAAPHLAGAAALLLSAKPSLSVDAILKTLTQTAVPLSTTVPNNDSGYGRIDAYAAVLSVIETGVLTGTVREKTGGAPIANAQVVAFSTGNGNTNIRSTGFTDAAGGFSMRVPFGIYTATASAFAFGSAALGPRLVITGGVVSLSFSLMEQAAGVVRGRVRDAATGNVVTATVKALNTPKSSLSINSCPPCRYSLDLPAGNYVLEARAVGYRVQTQTVSIQTGTILDLDFDMQPTQRIAFVDSGAWYYISQAPYFREALDTLALAYDEYRIKQPVRDTPTVTQLLKYDTVIWSSPFDSPDLVGASEAISGFLTTGKNLLLTGQDIAYYDGGGNGYVSYFDKLNAYFRAELGGASRVYGKPTSLLADKVLTITGGDSPYLFAAPDMVVVGNQDKGGLLGTYEPGDNPEGAGVYASLCFKHKSAFYAFGLEGLDSPRDRADVISRTLAAFATPRATVGVELVSRDSGLTNIGMTPAAIAPAGSTITHVLRVRNIGEAGTTDTLGLSLSGNMWPTKLATTAVTLKPCATTNVIVTVTIPPGALMNESDRFTVTATSQRTPTATDTLSFTTKTPGGILLVDDERFFHNEQKYLGALAASGNTHVDRWDNLGGLGTAYSPPLSVLKQYAIVIWFNGYDWYDPITPAEQDLLRKYLDGGGRLFFSSQAALQYTNGNGFDQTYLGVASVDYNDTVTNVVGAPGNPLGDGFVASAVAPFPYYWNLSTAVQPTTGTAVFLRADSGRGESGQPIGLARQGRGAFSVPPAQWRTALLPFAFEVLTTTSRTDLMNRVVGWLSWLGESSLTADRTSVNSGERVVYTLTLRADLFAGHAPSQSVSISVPLASGLSVVSSTLPNATANNAGAWQGVMKPGDVLTWTFEAVAGNAPDHTPLTATLRVNLNELGIHWTRDAVMRTAAPLLQARFSLAQTPKWDASNNVVLRLKNIGSTAVSSLTVSIPVPTGLGLPEDAAVTITNVQGDAPSADSASAVQQNGNLIIVRRGLDAGQEIEVTYPISIPHFGGVPMAFYNTARVETDAGLVLQAEQWLVPDTKTYWLPWAFKK